VPTVPVEPTRKRGFAEETAKEPLTRGYDPLSKLHGFLAGLLTADGNVPQVFKDL
jgi:hypothetical protein